MDTLTLVFIFSFFGLIAAWLSARLIDTWQSRKQR